MANKKINLKIFALTIFVASGCSKNNTPIEKSMQQSSGDSPKSHLDEIKDNSAKPVIDPSACRNNVGGYVYFKIGGEIFRVNEHSPININYISPDHMRPHKNIASDIPEGCEDNPYEYPGFVIEFKHTSGEPDWRKMKFDGFFFTFNENKDSENLNQAQVYNEEVYSSFKSDTNKRCEQMPNEMEKCGWKNDRNEIVWPRVYRSSVHTAYGHAFVLDCEGYVNGPRCQTVYQIFPNVYINYKFILSENKNWNEKNIISFDKYIRDSFSAIHYKSVNF